MRPADYVALLIFTALGTTVVSALGADSISLGASGMAFGVLGASAAFGWRRGVRGTLRSYFGLRIVPWLLALFAAGLGSAGVDNWGHAGGLFTGIVLGFFLSPRPWPGDAAGRRLAAAAGALLGTLAIGMVLAPALPALGPLREGPSLLAVKIPLGWRRAASCSPPSPTRTASRAPSAARRRCVQDRPCRGHDCACDRVVRGAIEDDLWRLADVGALKRLELGQPSAIHGAPGGLRMDGLIEGEYGQAEVSAACMQRENAPVALVVLQPRGGSTSLIERMAATLSWPGKATLSADLLAARGAACYGRGTRWRESPQPSKRRRPRTGATRFRGSCVRSPGSAGSDC